MDPANAPRLYGIEHFDWHGQVAPGPTENPAGCTGSGSSGDTCGGSPTTDRPVDLSSGIEVIQETDIRIRGQRGSISIERTRSN